MWFALSMLAIAAIAGYRAQQVLLGGGPRRRLYGVLLLADAVAGVVAYAASIDADAAGQAPLIGAIAAGAFLFLVVIPTQLRRLARWATRHDHIRLALRLLDLIDLLQPGMGAHDEREALSAFAELREGKTDRAIEALRAARAEARDPRARRAIDERMVFAYLTARRWKPAVEHFERNIEINAGPISANVLVEVLRAYGELGDRVRAADLMKRIEDSPLPGEPQLGPLVARARMVFLAFAGRAAAVEAMVAPRGPLALMAPSARAYWVGVARREAGDAAGARQALATAVAASAGDQRARNIAADELAALERHVADGGLAAVVLSEDIARLADRVGERAALAPVPRAQGAPVPQLDGVSWRRVPVTSALIAANLVVALLVWALLGSWMDTAVMLRAGANAHVVTASGEWWRLLSSTFLHFGPLHLAVNMYGLWVLGRVVEQIHGSRRFFVTYLLAGLGGSLASLLWSREVAMVSAGASGAVFGILGAAIAEFFLRRRAYPEAWRRAVLGNLVFLAVANLLIASAVPGIDQAAHVGGMLVGALAGAVLAPKSRFGRTEVARRIAAALGFVGVILLVGTALAVARTAPLATVNRAGWTRVDADGTGWSVEVPRLWRTMKWMTVRAGRDPSDDVTLAREVVDGLMESQKAVGVKAVEPSVQVDGWVARENRGTVESSLLAGISVKLHLRALVYVRSLDGNKLVVTFFLTDDLASEAAPIVRRVLSSARPPE